MSAMTATSDYFPVPPRLGPGPFFDILPWILWGWLGLTVAVMAVTGGMYATPRGRRYLREKDRNAPRYTLKLVVGHGGGVLIAGTALLILQLVSS